jgi:DNA-binding CsgD family transcriptional regulator
VCVDVVTDSPVTGTTVGQWIEGSGLAEVLAELVGPEGIGVLAIAVVAVGQPGQPVRNIPTPAIWNGCRPVRPGVNGTGWSRLTDRERAVAVLAGQALTNQQIAHRLDISRHTVNYHLRRIFEKLSIDSRVYLAQLVTD